MTFIVYNLGSKYPYFNRVYVVSSSFGARICIHSALMRILTKVRKTWMGPLQGDKAWSGDPKSTFLKAYIIRNTFPNLKHIWLWNFGFPRL